MFIDLARFTILPQQPSENPLSSHPKHLCRHPCLIGTLALTRASMSPFPLRGEEFPCSGTRVNGGGFDDDTPVLDEFLDVRAGISIPNFRLF